MKDNRLTIIDRIVKLYIRDFLSCEESTRRAAQEIDRLTWNIDDTDDRIHIQNKLYKRFFSKMHKAIIANERKG